MKNYLFLLLSILLSSNVYAAEEILNYHSEIYVNEDRSITVTETIVVNAEGRQIQRGIFRDIITTSENEKGRRIKYQLKVLEVLKDGVPENYEVSNIRFGERIRIGNADIILSPGQYTYTIKYKMENQVRFFKSYDEIYWNVTGNGWGFVIKWASATVYLPENATIIQHKGYSGGYSETGCACANLQQSDNIVNYRMTQPLYPQQGFTIAVGWNKGVIMPPTEAEIRKQELMTHLPLFSGIAGVLLVLLYYLFAWVRVGRDPAKGPIIPRFDAPEGFTPAAARFVQQMGFDKKAFTASIVNMAVKGFLTIEQTGKSYKLIKQTKDYSNLSKGEKRIAGELFKGSDSFSVKQSNHSSLTTAINNLHTQLKADFMKINFKKNVGWLVPGVILSIIVGIFMVIMNLNDEAVLFSFAISFFSLIFILPLMFGFYQGAKNSTGIMKYVFNTLFIAIPIGVIIIAYLFVMEFDPELHYFFRIAPFFLIMASLVVVNVLFFYLIKAPTVYGRKRMDEIEGLKIFMEVAEKHRFNMLNPPEMTPQLFERLLPYAIALNVENEWGKQFDSILKEAIQNDEYEPRWYRGSTGSVFHAHLLASTLGSNFSSSISSASVSPQSSGSSGSGGGGFSGGGGGGGGGGGW